MKKALYIPLITLLILTLAACTLFGGDDSVPVGQGIQTAAITFDLSNGSPEEKLEVVTHYAYTDIDIEDRVSALDGISHLKFGITLSIDDEDRMYADWSADSSLFKELSDCHPIESFELKDTNAMRWFMLDSLWRTLGSDEVNYTMDGGQQLVVEGLQPISEFPLGEPYMGSAHYFAQANDK